MLNKLIEELFSIVGKVLGVILFAMMLFAVTIMLFTIFGMTYGVLKGLLV